MPVSTGLGVTRPRHGADDGGINSLLRTMPQGQPVRDDFDAAVIRDPGIDVHVSQANVAGDPRPGFMGGSRREHTGRRGSAVMAPSREDCEGARSVWPGL